MSSAGIARRRGDDSGFTLIETMVAIGIISVVFAAQALLTIRSVTVDGHQTQLRTAIQVASTALENVNQLSGDAVLALPATVTSTEAPAYTEAFDVHDCWQLKTGGTCTDASSTAAVPTQMQALYRVTVTVTWADQRCSDGICSYVVSTLVSHTHDDPTFA